MFTTWLETKGAHSTTPGVRAYVFPEPAKYNREFNYFSRFYIQTLRLDSIPVGTERMVADGNSAFGGGQFPARYSLYIVKRFGVGALQTGVA